MNIEEQLNLELSRRNTDFIARQIGNDPEYFQDLMKLIFCGKEPVAMRASWVATTLTDKYPELIKPYLSKIITGIGSFKHPGTRRNLLRIISFCKVPEGLEGELYESCYRFVLSRTEPPAVKVHSMQIMYNISEKEPELKRELRLIIETLTNDDSAAIKSRCRHLIKRL